MEVDSSDIEQVSQQVLVKQGAEAKIYTTTFLGKPTIVKERFNKTYRHPVLDKSLTTQRTKSEVRSMIRCRMNGIATPAVYHVDVENGRIYMEHLTDAVTVKDHIARVQAENGGDVQSLLPLATTIGTTLGKLHAKNIVHGDLTTSNMLLRGGDASSLVLIDFGLGYVESIAEDKGVDLYVLERALLSTHPNTERLFNAILGAYRDEASRSAGANTKDVLAKFEEVRMRGRKRTMVG